METTGNKAKHKIHLKLISYVYNAYICSNVNIDVPEHPINNADDQIFALFLYVIG